MKFSAHTLDEFQRWMLAAVMEPASAQEQEVQQAILPSQRLSAEERLAVYQHAYVARLLEVLREQFPCTRFAAGDEVFDQFAIGYLQAHPPRSYTLGHLADQFPEYLEATRPRDWGEFLVEVARLEQAIDRVFDGPGPESGGRSQEPGAGNQPSERGTEEESLKLSFVPGLELHAFRYPISTFYTNWKAGEAPAWLEPEAQFVALFRREYIVRRHELSRAQYELLKGLQAGKTLGDALAAVAESLPDAALEQLAASVRDWFSRWTAGGFFTIAGIRE